MPRPFRPTDDGSIDHAIGCGVNPRSNLLTPLYSPYVANSFNTPLAVGGKPKAELLAELQAHGVELNESARALFAADEFSPSDVATMIEIVETTVLELGFPQGATTTEIYRAAATRGL